MIVNGSGPDAIVVHEICGLVAFPGSDSTAVRGEMETALDDTGTVGETQGGALLDIHACLPPPKTSTVDDSTTTCCSYPIQLLYQQIGRLDDHRDTCIV